MSFAFRPLMAAAAIALSTPAFAQTGTVAAPATPTATSTTAAQPLAKASSDLKTPDAKAGDKTVIDTKKDAMVKPDAKVEAKTDSKDTMKKSETTDKSSVKGKVSALHHHKTDKSEKTEKTAG